MFKQEHTSKHKYMWKIKSGGGVISTILTFLYNLLIAGSVFFLKVNWESAEIMTNSELGLKIQYNPNIPECN